MEDREEATREKVVEAMRTMLMDGHGVGAGEGSHVEGGDERVIGCSWAVR